MAYCHDRLNGIGYPGPIERSANPVAPITPQSAVPANKIFAAPAIGCVRPISCGHHRPANTTQIAHTAAVTLKNEFKRPWGVQTVARIKANTSAISSGLRALVLALVWHSEA